MKVIIPQTLRSYTDQRDQVDAEGETLDDVLVDLDRQFPGIRFRMVNEQDQIRPHIIMFVHATRTRDLSTSVAGSEEVLIMQALSGG
jgi:molybdopterin synthase sulfur carrier subunit